MAEPLTLHADQPGRHDPGRAKCSAQLCPKTAALRNMIRGSDGRLYGPGCARKLGLRRPRPHRTLNTLGARHTPGTLFDQPAREQPAMSLITTARRFVIERGDTRIIDGIVWPDGSCSLRWRQAPRSFVSWDTFADCVKIQVDTVPGARVVWVDDTPETATGVAELAAPAPSPDAQ